MKVKDFSFLEVKGFASQFLEIRIDYGAGSVPLYVGYNHTPNADPASATWYIVMLTYSGTNLVRQQLPSFGVTFTGIWNDRADYFP
jgi:hypothetical protein